MMFGTREIEFGLFDDDGGLSLREAAKGSSTEVVVQLATDRNLLRSEAVAFLSTTVRLYGSFNS